jgi:hypothetical protein
MTGAARPMTPRLARLGRIDLSRPGDRSALAAVGVAALLALLIWSPNIGGPGPGDPAAVAGDARLAGCGGEIADVEYAFPIPHARDYQRYLPAMARQSELDLDRPALVVVFRGPFPGVTPKPGATGARPAATTLRNLCIYVGPAGEGEINYYRDVSIAGLRATPDGPPLVPPPAT